MKWKLLSVLAVLFFVLAACQNADNTDNQDGANGNNNNVEPTRYQNNAGDGMVNDRNNTMERDADRLQNRDGQNNENNQYDVAEEAAQRITDEVEGIDRAYVLTTDNNAYVAANLDTDGNNQQNANNMNQQNGNDLTDEVKEQIGEIVKSVNNDIDNVYVSTNPDFLNLTRNYVNDADNGQPVEGFFDQMGNMVERLFPENSR